MREISPALNASCEEFLEAAPKMVQETVARIRLEKAQGKRFRPSTHLVDSSILLNLTARHRLLDEFARLVDENLFGRAEMCMQFAELLQNVLSYLGLPARAVVGTCIYYVDGKEVFRWEHAWVRVNEELIDGNVESLFENPIVPPEVRVAPYWGPIKSTPADRRLREDHASKLPPDEDVSNIWWPELRFWVEENIRPSI
jgi:hypothetical protein